MLNTLDNKIKISGIIKESIVDGPGIRYVIFFQGCNKRCYKCHNPETQSIHGGEYVEISDLLKDILKNPLLRGVTISGGEPFLQARQLLNLITEIKKHDLEVLIYTGYYYEELIEKNNKYIKMILDKSDYLIDGPFEYDKKDLNLLFRGSKNQRIIDLKETNKNYDIIVVENF